jgi:hypothetical protein
MKGYIAYTCLLSSMICAMEKPVEKEPEKEKEIRIIVAHDNAIQSNNMRTSDTVRSSNTTIRSSGPVNKNNGETIIIVNSLEEMSKYLKDQNGGVSLAIGDTITQNVIEKNNKKEKLQDKPFVYIPPFNMDDVEKALSKKPQKEEFEELVDLIAQASGKDLTQIKKRLAAKLEEHHETPPSSDEAKDDQQIVMNLRQALAQHKTISTKRNEHLAQNNPRAAKAELVRPPTLSELFELGNVGDKSQLQKIELMIHNLMSQKLSETQDSKTKITWAAIVGPIVSAALTAGLGYLTGKKTC